MARRQYFAIGAIHYVDVTIAVRVNKNFSRLPVDGKIKQNVLVYRIVVVEIVRAVLIKPDRLTGVGIARENASGQFVISRAGLSVPRARDLPCRNKSVELRVVRDPSPHPGAPDLPCIRQARSSRPGPVHDLEGRRV